jgi:Mg-chelatase subunit ChlD
MTHTVKKINIDIDNNDDNLYITLNTDDISRREPVNICCIIDNSGSMDSIETNKTSENNNLSRLDIVKHSVRTIINSLCENDYFSLVTFNSKSTIELKLTLMTNEGKQLALNKLNTIISQGQTNIWSGLLNGLELLTSTNDNNTLLLLLTDGESNINPPNGIINTLDKYLNNTIINKSYCVNTFGFGNNLDSELLNEISNKCNGMFDYISDFSMIGTKFVKSLANILTTYTTNIKLVLSFNDNDNDKLIINVGSLLYEQSRDLLIKINDNNININIKLLIANTINNEINYVFTKKTILNSVNIPTIIRYKIMDYINNIKFRILDKNYINDIKILYDDIKKTNLDSLSDKDKQIIYNYLLDYEANNDTDNKGGQIKLAIESINYYNTWGKHYLFSLMNAYNYQQCNNFKDPGIQHFGGKLFNSISDEIEEIFIKIPPPIPRNTYNNNNVTNPISMRSYYNQNGGCFDGNGLVKMKDGFKKVCNLLKDDIILSLNDKPAKIICIIKQKINTNKTLMCNINSELYISEWHPIYINNEWIFPHNNYPSVLIELDYIYNLILDSEHVVIINNIPIITLGHNFNNNDILKHDYYGTNKIIDDLKKIDNYENGLIIINNPQVIRENNLVINFYDKK